MAKSKKRALKSSRYFIELSKQRKLLILKRGRLLRTGESINVQKLEEFPVADTKAWLRATTKDKDTEAASHPWDRAHALAQRIKNELGELPYIEPEVSNGQTGIYRDLINVYSVREKDEGEDAPKTDAGDDFANFEPNSAVPDPLEQVRSLMPDSSMLPSFGMHCAGKQRQSGMLPPMASASVDIDQPSQHGKIPKNQGGTKGAIGKLQSGRFVFPLLHEHSDWGNFSPVLRRMLEVEMVQVYRGAELRVRYPNLEGSEIPALAAEEKKAILEALFELPMSKVLRRVGRLLVEELSKV